MNAHAEILNPPTITRTLPGARAEHISLESSPETAGTPLRHPHRKVRSTFKLSSTLRGCVTEVSILEDHYLAVRSERWREEPKKYVLDLRFANPKPVRVRHVAWFCLSAALVLLLTCVGALWSASSATLPPWTHPGFSGGIGAALAAAITLALFLRRTTESLQFTSVHGGATLISIVGGIGSAKSGKRFFVEMIKSINAAKLARPQPKSQFLRDEMREHHRLRELNVLSEDEYEASKQRILAAHS